MSAPAFRKRCEFACPEQVRKPGPGLDDGRVFTLQPVVLRAGELRWQILPEHAAEVHVQQLAAAADAEKRPVQPRGRVQDP